MKIRLQAIAFATTAYQQANIPIGVLAFLRLREFSKPLSAEIMDKQSKPKSKVIGIVCSSDLANRIQDAARLEDRSTAAWLRNAARQALGEQVAPTATV